MRFDADVTTHAARWGARLTALGGALLASVLLTAHVGTNQVVFEGRAGGYPVRVMIDPPGVVPAQVPIRVRVLEGTPTRITVQAASWNRGTKGAPPPEALAPVVGEPGLYALDLWIMVATSYAVYIRVDGPAGDGTLLVPMQASATRILGMKQGMGIVLAALGTLLVAGMLTIIGAARREGTLVPGATPDLARIRGGRIAMASGAALLALAVVGGAKWWDVEERAYKQRMARPLAITTSLRALDDSQRLTLAITDSLWIARRLPPLLPDHGKLMHLFLVGLEPSVSTGAAAATSEVAIAHVHPQRVHPDSFSTVVPSLPAGRYLLFADLLFQSGAQRTLVDTIDLPTAPVVVGDRVPASSSQRLIDPDDAARVMAPVALGTAASLAGGGTLTLRADVTPAVKRDLRLTATVVNADGTTATLEPYMGMQGHAMVLRRDGSLFMHLHPMGTASMTAQAQLARRERGDTAMLDSAAMAAAIAASEQGSGDHAMHMGSSGPVAFPFAFPSAGDYVVFVQVKRAGVVETAAFTVQVSAPVNGKAR